jgi:hypothetical protein
MARWLLLPFPGHRGDNFATRQITSYGHCWSSSGLLFQGMWYVLVVVDDFSRYSWVFFMKVKDEVFTHAQDLFLRLQNEFPKNPMRAIRSDNGTKFKKIIILRPFVLLWDMSISFSLCMCLRRMALLITRVGLLLRWQGRCLMSIGLLGAFGPKR